MDLMEKHRDKLRLALILLLSTLHVGFGLYAGQMPLLFCGAAGMAYVAVAVTFATLRANSQNGIPSVGSP
jgi:hypothetical protein